MDKPEEHPDGKKDKDVPLIRSDMPEFWMFKEAGKLKRRLSALEVDAGDRSALCSKVPSRRDETRNPHSDANGVIQRIGTGERKRLHAGKHFLAAIVAHTALRRCGVGKRRVQLMNEVLGSELGAGR